METKRWEKLQKYILSNFINGGNIKYFVSNFTEISGWTKIFISVKYVVNVKVSSTNPYLSTLVRKQAIDDHSWWETTVNCFCFIVALSG